MPQYYNTSIKNLIFRLRKFREILDEELAKEILKNEDVIIEMVRNQLYEGLDGYSTSIQPPYAARTIKRKIKKGQPTDRVTLRDTGDFYKSLYLSSDEKGFFIQSTDTTLVNALKKKYGSPILRLSDENLINLIQTYVKPSLKQKMKEYLQNG